MAAPGTKRRKMSTTEQERENVNARIVKNEKYEAEHRPQIQTKNQQNIQNKNIFEKLPIFENRAQCLADNDLQSYSKPCFETSADGQHSNTHNRSENRFFVSNINSVKMPIINH